MKLGVDLDDTLCDFVTPFLQWYNHKYDKNVKRSDLTDFNMAEPLELPEYAVPMVIEQFYRTWDFSMLPPYREAQRVVNDLIFDEKYVITARPSTTQFETLMWMNDHFRGTFNNVIYGAHQKGRLCAALGIDVMIDDRYETIVDCAAHNVPSILLNKPWNEKHAVPLTSKRVYSWDEIGAMQR